jgi:hypothetical protein
MTGRVLRAVLVLLQSVDAASQETGNEHAAHEEADLRDLNRIE